MPYFAARMSKCSMKSGSNPLRKGSLPLPTSPSISSASTQAPQKQPAPTSPASNSNFLGDRIEADLKRPLEKKTEPETTMRGVTARVMVAVREMASRY